MEYEHKISNRSRSLRLKVTSSGQVILSTPPRTPQRVIDAFLSSHLGWIQAAKARVGTRPAPVQSDKVQLFGKWYQLDVRRSLDEKVGVRVEGERIVVVPSDPDANETAIVTILNRFLKTTAEKYIVPRTHQWAHQMHIEFRAISLREQKTRWGSCSSRGNLQFNWRLVHYPPEIIDYVIIHELAHRREMNHSSSFWAIVREYDPAHLQHRGWLKRNGWTEG